MDAEGREGQDALDQQRLLLQAVEDGDLKSFKELLNIKEADRIYGTPHYMACLEMACIIEGGQVFIKPLLDKIKSSLRKGRKGRPSQQKMLLDAVEVGDLESFKELLNITEADRIYGLPHYMACLDRACMLEGRHEFVKSLLTKVKPTVNTIVPEPIHYAAKCGNFRTLETLLEDKRTKVNAEDSNGRTALHYTVEKLKDDMNTTRYEKCIEILMQRSDFDINKRNKMGFTAIHAAAEMLNERAIEFLLKYGESAIDIDQYKVNGRTARDVIRKHFPHLETKLPFPVVHMNTISPNQVQLLTAIKNKQKEVFIFLLRQRNPDGNIIVDPSHWYDKPFCTTILEMACRENECAEFVRIALQAGADPMIVNRNSGKAPIHVAAEMGNHDALQILLSKDVNINATDKSGRTALHYTVKKVNSDEESREILKCLMMLLNHEDLDLNVKDYSEKTAILLAIESINREAVIKILESQNHLHVDDTLREMLTRTFPDLVQKLPQTGVVKNIQPNAQKLLLQHLYDGYENGFVSLLRNARDIECAGLLQCSCKTGLTEAVRVLLERDVDPNAISREDSSPPAVLACKNQHYEILKLFLELPPNREFKIDATDGNGNSALHYAVWNQNLECVIALINVGADMGLENIFGKPALDTYNLKNLLDKCITNNGKFPGERDYELIFDYRLVTAHPGRIYSNEIETNAVNIENISIDNNSEIVWAPNLTSEMNFLRYMAQHREYQLLLNHPVVLTFLELKSRGSNYFIWTYVVIYFAFYAYFSVQVVPWINSIPWHNNETNETNVRSLNESDTDSAESYDDNAMDIYGHVARILSLILINKGLLDMSSYFKGHGKKKKGFIKLCMICVTLLALFLFSIYNKDIMKVIVILAILISSLKLIILVGRTFKFAPYIEMLKVVLKHFLSVSIIYSFFIFAFAVSFHVLFHDINDEHNWFDTIPNSLLKTLMMFTGEFDMKKDTFKSAPVLSAIVFSGFVLLMTIVLLNLIISLTVLDTEVIRQNKDCLCLKYQINVLTEIESTLIQFCLVLKRLSRLKPTCLLRMDILNLFPPCCKDKKGVVRPNNVPVKMELPPGKSSLSLSSSLLKTTVDIINKRLNDDIIERNNISQRDE